MQDTAWAKEVDHIDDVWNVVIEYCETHADQLEDWGFQFWSRGRGFRDKHYKGLAALLTERLEWGTALVAKKRSIPRYPIVVVYSSRMEASINLFDGARGGPSVKGRKV